MKLEELQNEFIFNLKGYFDEKFEIDCKGFLTQLDKVFTKVKEYQINEAAVPVQQVCICFLNTSYYLNEPKIRVILYAPNKIWKEDIFHQDFDARWLVNPLESYRKDLEKLAKEEHLKPEWLQVELRRMLKILLMMARYYFKYEIRQICMTGHAKEMFKDTFFGVSFGEYMDWQFPIYSESEEVDLLQAQSNDDIRYKSFEKKIYRKTQIFNRDLSSCIFNECDFLNSEWRSINYNDVIFKHCKFKNITFDQGTMYGTTFEECTFENAKFVNISIEQTEEEAIKNGFHRMLSFVDCEGGEDGVFFADK